MENQVKPGYKQTEVGVIPDDWDISNVGEQFEVQLGKMLDAEKNQGVFKPYLNNRTVQWNYIDTSNLLEMKMTSDDLKRFRLKQGDLLVCEGGEVGRAAIWNQELGECYYQKTLHRLRPLKQFNIYLMIYFLQYWAEKNLFNNYVSRTSIAHLTREKFIQVSLPIPPIAEQDKIAEALSGVDALIESLEELIAKKRHIKQGAMQELLTGKRRIINNGEWIVEKLENIANIFRGASPRPIDSPIWFDENSEIGWVRISDVTKSGITLKETDQYLSALGVKHSRFVESGNLIMSICATVGRPIITGLDVCIHDGFVVFDSLKANKNFIYYVLQLIESKWSQHGQTGSQMNLNTNLINRTKILSPPKEEQEAIAEVLTDMDNETTALEEKLTKTRQLKQGMMQELLTGRTRLV